MAFESITAARIVTRVSIVGIVAINALLYFRDPAYLGRVYGWIVFGIGILAIWWFLETAGERILGARVFSRMSSGARILAAVPIALAFVAIGWALLWFLAIVATWIANAI